MVKPMPNMDDSTKLLTMLNVDSARPTKRQRSSARDWHQIAKKARAAAITTNSKAPVEPAPSLAAASDSDDEEAEANAKRDSFDLHWSHDSPLVEGKSADELKEIKWRKTKKTLREFGESTEWLPQNAEPSEVKDSSIYNARLMDKFSSHMGSTSGAITPQQHSLLTHLSTYRDLFLPTVTIASHTPLRSALALHAMNHVLKTRARVLKNNDALARAAADPTAKAPERNTQDQGFTRPKVLVLLPFRNSALEWIDLLTSLSSAESVENQGRFHTEYSLPEGATDKLAENPEQYAEDHVATFKGNIDDSFRVGLKVTRKTIKLYSEFYSADVIVASPLGLRTSIEKEKGDSDFLSSIELLIVDQMDVMTMQNWDHLQFVMERVNKLPEEAHGCDFSRVKPWYLDGKSASLRQSVLLSTYETPEMRALFSKQLLNVAGKVRAEPSYPDGQLSKVPKGIKQVFTRFECADLYSEDDKRFEWFTTKTLPMLLKSAVSSSQTIIFVPSYFDFVRLKRYMKKLDDFSFASISEYSPTPDVSRARGAFFAGKKSFLLVTERFHFFRRYRIRGAKTYVFYAPPSHAAYYPEVLSFPFPRLGQSAFDEPEVDCSELSCQVLFSKFDLMALERVVGTEDARRMCKASEAEGSRFTFLE